MSKTVYFVFPSKSDSPTGGYKIAFQYADFLASQGYKVKLILPFAKLNFKKENGLFLRFKTFAGFYYRLLRNHISSANWYNFKNKIQKKYIFHLNFLHLHKFSKESIFFATSVETAYELNKLKNKLNIFYLIQDFENWHGNTDNYIYNSYNFPFTKIVISKWLQKEVENTGNTAYLIPNGLDFNYFRLTIPIESRSPYEIALLYHLDNRKRCCDSMAALNIVKQNIPELHITMFGAPDKPLDLPDWYSYYKTPDRETHNKIYNTASIFVAASEKEGWALPPAEAMQCGAALVCTQIGGFADYAINEESALLSPVYDVQTLADNILRLIKDNDLRIKIAKSGNNFIQKFTLENANYKLLDLLKKIP